MTIKKEFVAYVISWTESEAGWGCRPDGYSLHVSPEEAVAYIDEYWAEEKKRNPSGRTPHEYSRPDSRKATLTKVTSKAAKALREATAAGKHGIRLWQMQSLDYIIRD